MRFRLHLRVAALAMSAVTILGAGAVAVSVSASAGESAAPAEITIPAGNTTAADAALLVDLKTIYLNVAHERVARNQVAAAAKARKDARDQRIRKVRARIVAVARNQIGDRYSAGSSGPSAFDCSGFTRYVYRVAAGKELPHYSRAQYTKVKKIPLKQALPGDLVFFLRNGAHHVGIYLGHGRMVDAAGYGKGVKISPISGSWWSRTFTGLGRLLPT